MSSHDSTEEDFPAQRDATAGTADIADDSSASRCSPSVRAVHWALT